MRVRAAKVSMAILSIGLLAAGCRTVAYDRPNTTQQQMLNDRTDCAHRAMGYTSSGGWVYGQGYQSSGASMPNGRLYDNCMAAKGYVANSEGRLVVPNNLKMQMY